MTGSFVRRGSTQTNVASGAPGPHGQPLTRSSLSRESCCGTAAADFEQQLRAAGFADSFSNALTLAGAAFGLQHNRWTTGFEQQHVPARMLAAEQRQASVPDKPCW